MRLRDRRIGTQLTLGLGLVTLFVALLGGGAWYQGGALWEITRDLYDHPYTVQRALGDLRAKALVIQRSVRELLLVDTEAERGSIYRDLEAAERELPAHLDVVQSRYLGPREDLTRARAAFEDWRDEVGATVVLVKTGARDEAMKRVRRDGVSAKAAWRMLAALDTIKAFAEGRADRFYAEATALRERLRLAMSLVIGVVLALTALVVLALRRNINAPLQQLAGAARSFAEGDLGARAGLGATNELGQVGAQFDRLAEAVQAEMDHRTHASRVAAVMLSEEDARPFCQKLLVSLLQETGAQAAAVYLLGDSRTQLSCFESVGFGAAARASFSVTDREGELGAAVASRKICRVTAIPDDTPFVFPTVGGHFRPRELVALPVVAGADVVAVVALASLAPLSPPALRLLDDVFDTLTARLNGVLAFQRARQLATELEQQNRELDAQKRELSMQADELSEQNIELEVQKRQLDEASRLKSRFLATMSHELRTPLNSVIALSNVLTRRLGGIVPAEEHGYLAIIERNGRRLLGLINDLLDLSRIEAGREQVLLGRVNVAELVQDALVLVEAQAREKGVTVRAQVPTTLPSVTTDADKCRHILQNLLDNAVKFTSEGSVEVSAREVTEGLAITVSDTGIGIPPDKIPIIFDEFRQGDEAASRRFGGSGLGLAIARGYATLLGGTIDVRSTPGKGSVFTLTLPRSAPASADEGALPPPAALPGRGRSAPSPARSDGEGKSLLLVEDSEPAAIQIVDILVEKGYRVHVASGGAEALEHLATTVPDGMILDLTMPGVDGFEVLRQARASEATQQLPVLILTARHVTAEELSFLKGNHIFQLIQKGALGRVDLLAAVTRMVSPHPAPVAAPGPAPAPVDGRRRTILVVEDNPDNLTTVRALLEPRYTVLAATDGQAGVELAGARRPDLVLMDISLPVLDGFAAFAALRGDPALAAIPVVALTARAMKGARDEILAAGFDGYIPKPIEPALLLQAVEEKLHGA